MLSLPEGVHFAHKMMSNLNSPEMAKQLRKPFTIFGITFAPLLLPLERRLQTLGILWILFLVLSGPFWIGFMSYLLLYSDTYRWIVILYAAVVIYQKDLPHRGSYQNMWFRKNGMWRLATQYFPINLVKTCDLDPSKNYLMGYHPHGVIGMGTLAISSDGRNWEELFPGVKRRMITLPIVFWLPLFREFAMATGACASSRESIKYCLTKPNFGVTCLVVGGAQEALQGDEETVELTLKNRKGFVRLALESGADLIPCFAFGEQHVFKLVNSPEGSKLRRFQEWAKSWLSFSPVLFTGRGIFQYIFGLLPYRRPINVVIGSPLAVDKVENPTQEQVDETHAKYVEALRNLYNAHNPIYGTENVKLVI